MREYLKDKFGGLPILESIYLARFEAEDEWVGLSANVSQGRNFYDLEGDELEEYVRRCLHSILEHGALPAINVGDEWPVMEATTAYGTKRDEIVENIIGEWKKSGRDPVWGEYAFAVPKLIEPMSLERFRKVAAERG